MRNPLDMSKSNKKKRFVTGEYLCCESDGCIALFPRLRKTFEETQNIIHVSPPFNKTKTWTDLPFVLKAILY